MFDRDKWNKNYKKSEGYKKWLKESGERKRIRYNSDSEYRDRVRQQDNRRRKKLKVEVLLHYSKGDLYPYCNDCTNSDIIVLSIDHINGGGTQHRKELKKVGMNFYSWLKKNNYPVGYDTVCMNCNFKRRHAYLLDTFPQIY